MAEHDQKLPVRYQLSDGRILISHNVGAFIEPKWNVVQPIKTPLPPEVTQSQEQPVTGLKPRIWTSVS